MYQHEVIKKKLLIRDALPRSKALRSKEDKCQEELLQKLAPNSLEFKNIGELAQK